MAANVKWYGDEFRANFAQGLTKNLNAAGSLVVKEVKKVLNVRGQTRTTTTTRTGKVRRRYGRMGSEPSRQGEAPRKQTGRLFRSVRKRLLGGKFNKATKRRGKSNRVRVSSAGWLMEFKLNRPFMKNTFHRLKPQLAAIMTRPVPVKGRR